MRRIVFIVFLVAALSWLATRNGVRDDMRTSSLWTSLPTFGFFNAGFGAQRSGVMLHG
jgi:hypothetical protein